MQLAVNNPNFSIIVPTGCNARCAFCFWKQSETIDKDKYLNNLEKMIAALPEHFKQCSITGGEPTALPWLIDILAIVRKRFNKVVMSSNGYKLSANQMSFIDHLNISRHDIMDRLNKRVFKTDTVPNMDRLKQLCQTANEYGVDVTLNRVLPEITNESDIISTYIYLAKAVGANHVCFRKEHSDLKPLPVTQYFNQKRFNETSCPACKSYSQYIDGMKVTWKYNVLEPTEVMTGLYELVFHPDGVASTDWVKTNIVRYKQHKEKKYTPSKISGGCGSNNGCSAAPITGSCGSGGC